MSENSIKLTDLKPDPANANRGTERGLRMLDDSLSKVGLGRSIVVDKDMNVIAGNKTLETAIDRGFEDALIVHTKGDKLVVVVRDDMDLLDNDPNNPARQYAYLDNRVGQLDLEWDAEQLMADVQAGFNFDGLFYDWELDQLRLEPDDFDPNKEWQGMPEFEQDGVKPFHSLRLHFKTEDDMRAFAELVGQVIEKTTSYLYYPVQQKEQIKGVYEVSDES